MWLSCDYHVTIMWLSCDWFLPRDGWPSRRLWRKLSQQTVNDRVVSWTLFPHDSFLCNFFRQLFIVFLHSFAVALGAPVESTAIIRSFRGCVWLPTFSFDSSPSLLPFFLLPFFLLPFLPLPPLPSLFPPQADYAEVKVFKTEKKGWGLLAITAIPSYAPLCLSH